MTEPTSHYGVEEKVVSADEREAARRSGVPPGDAPVAPPAAALERALRYARHSLGADVTVLRLLILLNVHLHPASSQRELSRLAGGISPTALSRNLADLSAWSSRKQAGLGLIELRSDPMNLRVKRIHLTEDGERFMQRVCELLATSDESP